ncbi:TlpA disulfide reductase family protein [Chitinophaga sp. sic0106]|uniref:TlpA disulfide reductase family protein n=1 Tax=Chitinophaga sp. sic0106 TaxID=2854785 RepID=UPI001C4656D7|nr:TlpA disulfide reductase family protein [Chitinophaga sp. sic0106]MBV7530677.1 AhpC/TSA family protein [Chitinophaga sp. sic0106]
MKFQLITVTATLFAGAAMAQKPYTLNGKIQGLNNAYVYLSYALDGKYQTDSALAKNGSFTFKGQLAEPTMARMYADKQAAMMQQEAALGFFMEPGTMTVSGNKTAFSKLKVTGSATQKEQEQLEAQKAPVMGGLKPVSDEYNKLNSQYIAMHKAKAGEVELEAFKSKMTVVKDKMDPFYEQLEKIDIDYVKKHPASYVSAQLLRWRVSSIPLEEGEALYAAMPANIQASADGRDIRKELDGLKMGSPGSVAHVFAKKDINGEPLSLADFKGKYVLVDFWASWCVPCRKGNPHLKSLYAKYKEKGFEIIGISDDDRNDAAWKKAVNADGIGIWKHVLRGLDMEKRMANQPNPDDISDYYGIHSLPTKILIDPNGMIIGRYGGGGENDEAMDKKLASIFGNI